jgi:ribonuclease BN (tRNA processing enzyme)
MKLTFIGTSDAFGAGGRRQAAILVETASGGLLLDCAPTTGSGLAALSIPRDAIDAVVVSHFHADHFAGVPQLLLAAIYEDRRRHPLVVAGPAGVEERVRGMADAVGYPLTGRELPFALRFVEIAPGAPREIAGAHIGCFPTRHDPKSCPHGLSVAAGRRRLVYSGDTGWFDELPDHARDVDLFVCECTFHAFSLPEHLSYLQLADRRSEFRCDRMLLTHLGSEMTDRRGQLEIDTADDGLVIQL